MSDTGAMGERECRASPDHADILETIENAANDWKAKGYTSALAEVRDMANVGRALMEALPKGYSYMNCPSEIVSDLQNERAKTRLAHSDETATMLAAVQQFGGDGTPVVVRMNGNRKWSVRTLEADRVVHSDERVGLVEALEGCVRELEEMYRVVADTKRDAQERIEREPCLVSARTALTSGASSNG